MAKGTRIADDSNQESIAVLDNDKESPEPKNDWKYSSEDSEKSDIDKVNISFNDIKWSASEYIAHDKNITWYLILVIITAILCVGIYLLTHDIISTIVIALVGGMMGYYAGKKPRLLNYIVNNSGITIQDKLFSYDSFKSFSIMDESAVPNIILIPLKRFMPSLTVYLDPDSEGEVIKVLSARLPQDIYHSDVVDRFFQRVRF